MFSGCEPYLKNISGLLLILDSLVKSVTVSAQSRVGHDGLANHHTMGYVEHTSLVEPTTHQIGDIVEKKKSSKS